MEGNEPPPTPINSLNTSNQNIEIAILFSIIERLRNYVSGDVNTLQPLEQGL
jgi:hypothetical protein